MEHSDQGHKYTCPVHPQVIEDKSGKCPICGMNLVSMSKTKASHSGHGSIYRKS